MQGAGQPSLPSFQEEKTTVSKWKIDGRPWATCARWPAGTGGPPSPSGLGRRPSERLRGDARSPVPGTGPKGANVQFSALRREAPHAHGPRRRAPPGSHGAEQTAAHRRLGSHLQLWLHKHGPARGQPRTRLHAEGPSASRARRQLRRVRPSAKATKHAESRGRRNGVGSRDHRAADKSEPAARSCRGRERGHTRPPRPSLLFL